MQITERDGRKMRINAHHLQGIAISAAPEEPLQRLELNCKCPGKPFHSFLHHLLPQKPIPAFPHAKRKARTEKAEAKKCVSMAAAAWKWKRPDKPWAREKVKCKRATSGSGGWMLIPQEEVMDRGKRIKYNTIRNTVQLNFPLMGFRMFLFIAPRKYTRNTTPIWQGGSSVNLWGEF